MKADITRDTFDPRNRFCRVLMQQGRVQLDADANEQSSIVLHFLRSFAADVIGPHGGPASNLGFRMAEGSMNNDFAIGPGHYYVDGILCELSSLSDPIPIYPAENEHEFKIPEEEIQHFEQLINHQVLLSGEGPLALLLVTIKTVNSAGIVGVATGPHREEMKRILHNHKAYAYVEYLTFLTQPDYPLPAGTKLIPGSYLIYLDVWERLITYVEYDRIREVALNGADTAARAKLVTQVKHLPVSGANAECVSVEELTSLFQPAHRGHLRAQARQDEGSTDPSIISPDATYRGPENQLYRVEIHSGSIDNEGKAQTPTFKWSRENGSVVFPIVSLNSAEHAGSDEIRTTVQLEDFGRDDRFGLSENDWVELLDENLVLMNEPGDLLQVQSINRGQLSVTLSGSARDLDMTRHPFLRRWDQTFDRDISEGGFQMGIDSAAEIKEGVWIILEDGVQVEFVRCKREPSHYRTGDYWLIPARTATGDIDWPRGTRGPSALPPMGIEHHYAPLAIITRGEANPGIKVNACCQRSFPDLTSLEPKPDEDSKETKKRVRFVP
jgi:hypothetical protein